MSRFDSHYKILGIQILLEEPGSGMSIWPVNPNYKYDTSVNLKIICGG